MRKVLLFSRKNKNQYFTLEFVIINAMICGFLIQGSSRGGGHFASVAAFHAMARLPKSATKPTMSSTIPILYQRLERGIKSSESRMISTTMTTSDSYDKTEEYDHSNDQIVLDPLIVCGPSGVGKGTIISKYMEEYNGKKYFGFTTSHTTRSPRDGEVHSVHYYFTDKQKMTEQINNGEFLEYAEVHGNIYGTSYMSLKNVYEKLSKKCLLDIDVQGVQKIKSIEKEQQSPLPTSSSSLSFLISSNMILKPKYIFIAPPDFNTLKTRLMGRGTESKESLERRTANAKKELDYGLQDGNFDKIVINDDLDKACYDFYKTIQEMYNLQYHQE